MSNSVGPLRTEFEAIPSPRFNKSCNTNPLSSRHAPLNRIYRYTHSRLKASEKKVKQKGTQNYYRKLHGESFGLKFNPSESDLFQAIPKSVSEQLEIIPNRPGKRFVFRLMKIGQKLIRIIPIHFSYIQGFNPNESELALMQTEF